jgi:5-hydroxyisourate hydrolase
VSASLSTHVLDTVRGRPAAGIEIELVRLDGEARAVLHTEVADADGRFDFGAVDAGEYELVFAVGGYFGEAAFLDRVPVRFRVAGGHYHVPLLVSPWSYSTYRGS